MKKNTIVGVFLWVLLTFQGSFLTEHRQPTISVRNQAILQKEQIREQLLTESVCLHSSYPELSFK